MESMSKACNINETVKNINSLSLNNSLSNASAFFTSYLLESISVKAEVFAELVIFSIEEYFS
jgi:hypothetical protein